MGFAEHPSTLDACRCVEDREKTAPQRIVPLCLPQVPPSLALAFSYIEAVKSYITF
jgi:hypothetical protein